MDTIHLVEPKMEPTFDHNELHSVYIKEEHSHYTIKSENMNFDVDQDMMEMESKIHPTEFNVKVEDVNEDTEYFPEYIKNEELILKEEVKDVCFCAITNGNAIPIGVPGRAAKTIPKGTLELRPSPINGFGIYTLRHFQKGVQFGPYEGKLTKRASTEGYVWKLIGGRLLDQGDDTESNYLQYINCARDVTEQNLEAFQRMGEIYFRTYRDVTKDEELLIYFDKTSHNSYYKPQEENTDEEIYGCQFCQLGFRIEADKENHQQFCRFTAVRAEIDNEKPCRCTETGETNQNSVTSPPLTPAPKKSKTPAERQREYRLRQKKLKEAQNVGRDKPAKKTRADYQQEYRLRQKLKAKLNSGSAKMILRQEVGASGYLAPITTAQLTLSSPNAGPIIIQQKPVIETVELPTANRKKKTQEQLENVSKVQKLKRVQYPTGDHNFNEICHLPSQSILDPRLPNDETPQISNQHVENSDFDKLTQPQDNDDGKHSVSAIEDEHIENEDDFNMEESLSTDDSSHPYIGYRLHQSAHKLFKKMFVNNSFGHACNVCDRLWFLKDLKSGTPDEENLLKQITTVTNVAEVKMCKTCKVSVTKGNIPSLATYNGFKYSKRPADLPELDIIAERLISPRLPFIQIRRLRHFNSQFAISGQIMNVPISVNNMINFLPRPLDGQEEDFCINVHIKKKLIHKTSYVHGLVKRSVIKRWLTYLVQTPLYKHFQIKVDDAWFTTDDNNVIIDYTSVEDSSNHDNIQAHISPEAADHTPSVNSDSVQNQIHIDDLSEHIVIDESLTAQQQTVMWSEDRFLQIALGENKVSETLLFDKFVEELSFPAIYLGEFRVFRDGITVTPFMMATSELRRSDRRGVGPNKLLYTALKIMRLRVCDVLKVGFKHIGKDNDTCKDRILPEDYINTCLERNLAFMKSIPNSAAYWSERKQDLFAMMRQLGRPTMFLTISANEIGWPNLLRILHKFKNQGGELSDEQIEALNYFEKSTLVNEDAVICAIYFNKLVNVIMAILQSKRFSPFGKYRVLNYFKRIEFQHRGSPHAHILLWLDNAPKDALGIDYEEAIALINSLVSVGTSQASGYIKLQTHKHTFTCYKNTHANVRQCRFDAPFMPIHKTTILTPLEKENPELKTLKLRYKDIRKNLEYNDYNDIEHFYQTNNIISDDDYINVLRAGISRPRVFIKRQPSEKWHNCFNPFILNVVGSNMDFQFITEEYSCAQYVVDYINKNRGISNLQYKLLEILNENPDFDIVAATKKFSVNVLNSVEMSSQEAAWFLLRQPMSKASVTVDYIPTYWPQQRHRIRKALKELAKLDDDGTHIWKENWFDKYEKRPVELDDVTLAQFVSRYNVNAKREVREQKIPKIIRYRNYDLEKESTEYKREMVTLHIPFRIEETDILSDMKFLRIFDENQTVILERRKEFESNLDITKTMEICVRLCREELEFNNSQAQ